MGDEFRFNNDLLRYPQDRKTASEAYGEIFFALDNPDLRARFEPRDDAGNAAKKRSRRRGVQAVSIVTIALLITASLPLFERAPEWFHGALAALGGLLGVIGTYLGLSGVLFGQSKREWLRNRLTTERLRQLHFQILLALAPLALKAVETGDTAPFLKARRVALARFEGEQIADLDAKLASVLRLESGEEPWLLDIPFDASAAQGPHADLFLTALAHLRIHHQIDFAEYKLSSDGRLFSTLPFRQIRIIDGSALTCVLLLLATDVLVLTGIGFSAPPIFLAVAHIAAIWFAIVALALRTLEEGFQPHREVERYRQYGLALRLIRDRFQSAANNKEKMQALKDLEDLSYWEMVSFLKSNDESRFVM